MIRKIIDATGSVVGATLPQSGRCYHAYEAVVGNMKHQGKYILVLTRLSGKVEWGKVGVSYLGLSPIAPVKYREQPQAFSRVLTPSES